jgi:O-antigen ligase
MQSKNSLSYSKLIIIHLIIGFVVFLFPLFTKLYSILIIGFGLILILKSKNANNEALVAAAYLVGAEVLLRMTGGVPLYEFGKYGILLFLFIGMLYQGFSKSSFIYWIFIIILLPGVFYSFITLSFDADIRKAILFNLSGPLSLAISAIYCYNRKISLKDLNNVILAVGLPVVSVLVYLIFYTPSIKEVVTGTGSNFETSGGFGPNQVSTVLGLATFVFLSRAILASSSILYLSINLIISFLLAYRGIVTFSRGGMFTAFIMVFALVFVLYLKTSRIGKVKLSIVFSVLLVMLLAVWTYSEIQTNGLINKRYANQDALGREKSSMLTGREDLMQVEIDFFLQNPILGIGVGNSKEERFLQTGNIVQSHSEITRMLAEHGILGIIGLMILILTPLLSGINNKHHIYLYSFFIFWLLTINHAAMRIAAPGFIYGLSLLKVRMDDDIVHRE